MFFVYTTIVSLPILCFTVKCLCEHTFMEFISLNAATLTVRRETGEWALQSIPYRIYFWLSYRVGLRRKNARLYLNGIVIASLSAASGTRWILTACRFKICSETAVAAATAATTQEQPILPTLQCQKLCSLSDTHTHTYSYDMPN